MQRTFKYRLYPNRKQRETLTAQFAVDPRGTSQTCVCGAKVPKRLSDREHVCTACGLMASRDHVSAQVILATGTDSAFKRQRRRGNAMRSLRSPSLQGGEYVTWRALNFGKEKLLLVPDGSLRHGGLRCVR